MIKIYTDGSYIQNKRVGGWAAISIDNNNNVLEFYSGIKHSITNIESITAQRMEVIAVLEGLFTLSSPSDVTIITKSSYVNDVISKGWLDNWVRKGDYSKKHLDLWMMIYNLSKIHNISSELIYKNSENVYSKRSSELAKQAALQQTELPTKLSPDNIDNLFDLASNSNHIEIKTEPVGDPLPFDFIESDSSFETKSPFIEEGLPFSEELPFSKDLKLNKSDKEIKESIHVSESSESSEKVEVKENSSKSSKKKRSKKKKSNKKAYYAVARGRKTGIFNTWTECQKQVNKFKGAKFKKFDYKEDAEDYIRRNK